MASVEVTRPAATVPDDGGYASRKFLGFLYGSLLFAALAVMSCFQKLVLLKDVLGDVVGGTVALYGLYVGGNVVTKWGAGKHAAATKTTSTTSSKPTKGS